MYLKGCIELLVSHKRSSFFSNANFQCCSCDLMTKNFFIRREGAPNEAGNVKNSHSRKVNFDSISKRLISVPEIPNDLKSLVPVRKLLEIADYVEFCTRVRHDARGNRKRQQECWLDYCQLNSRSRNYDLVVDQRTQPKVQALSRFKL